MHATFFDRTTFARVAWVLAVVPFGVLAGCQGNRMFSPLASRSTMDGSPPSMHGSRLANFGDSSHSRGHAGVRVTSENAVPETGLAPVEQRLATVNSHQAPSNSNHADDPNQFGNSASFAGPARQTSPRQTSARPASDPQSSASPVRPASHVMPPAQPEISRTTQTQQALSDPIASRSDQPAAFEMPAEYEGVDVSALMKALQDAPPEVQKAAIGRLIAMSRQRAQPTQQPRSIEDALAASFDSLPTLPDEVIDRGINPTRLAASTSNQSPKNRHPRFESVANDPVVSRPAATQVSFSDLAFTEQDHAENHTADHLSSQPVQAVAAQQPPSDPSQVSQAVMEVPVTKPGDSHSQPAIEKVVAVQAPEKRLADSLTDAQLFDALVSRLQTKTAGESEADRHRRTVMTRHLMVLAGDPDRAVEKIEGLSNEEEEFLRHQLLGLWTIIDPNGHPVPSRRLSSALPEMRKATGYLAAASDSLEVRGLQFCTEIEAYGEVTPFPEQRFDPGQEVILYCEVENFIAADLNGGYETRLQGSYDLLDRSGRRISSQTLPEDRQVSKNHLRDYFVAYQMYLPDAISPGRYQLRLTMEDVHGKKYGQSTIDFEIKR